VRLLEVDPASTRSASDGEILRRLQYADRAQAAFSRRSSSGLKPAGDRRPAVQFGSAIDNDTGGIQIEGRPSRVPASCVERRSQGYPGYFRAMRSLAAGRAFTWQTTNIRCLVAIISRTAAELYWPNEDPTQTREYLRRGEQGPCGSSGRDRRRYTT